ncbi:MAG: hypothetical protein WDK96_01315 [Candidatus Paceibacterota bacterium]|jgi:hypothetical protein
MKTNFETWKTIDVIPQDLNVLNKTFKTNNIKIGTYGDYLLFLCKGNDQPYDCHLRKTLLIETPVEIQLIKVTVADLGFRDGAIYPDICDRAEALDLDYCPYEAGPQLRLQYQDQPEGEKLHIPIKPTDGSLIFFYHYLVYNINNILYLGGSDDCGGRIFWHGNQQIFVFCKKINKQNKSAESAL